MSDVEGHPASDVGGTMATAGETAVRARAGARAFDRDVDRDVKALKGMSVPKLAEKYLELYGEPTRSRNRQHLIKRLTWRTQELAYGGLDAGALNIISKLGDMLPEGWRRRLAGQQQPTSETAPRDPRLPPVGTVLKRVFEGITHEVRIGTEDFVYRDQRFKSLSAVARRITGTPWNGFLFFSLKGAAE
jgi:hypothetical protein